MKEPLLVLLFVAILHGVGSGLRVGPGYRVSERPCSRDAECSRELGEVCWWLYDGCEQGQCMCPPATHAPDEYGLCVPVKLGNEACRPETDRCPDGMECRNGTCQCNQGTMHSGDRFCIRPHQRLLGQACDPSTDRCYHKTSYGLTYNDVACSPGGQCQCLEGTKAEHGTCRRLHIDEWGCTAAFHCERGAICLDGHCRCPVGYRAVAGNTKCAKVGALFELPRGQTCDESNEKAYCARGLVCHRCASKNHHSCVRYHYLSYEGERAALSSSSLPLSSACLSFISLLALTTSYVSVSNR